MKSLEVKTIDKSTIETYSNALKTYYNDIIESAKGKSIIDVATLKNKMEDFLSRVGGTTNHLFNPKQIKVGDRFRAEEYNSIMTDLYIDTLAIYNKILLLEKTIDKVIDTQLMFRKIITNKMEEAFISLDILEYILSNNVLFDNIHIISNNINKHVDINSSADINANSAYLKVLDKTGIPDKYLMNDVRVIPFNTNINIKVDNSNIDKYNILNIYGVSSTEQLKLDNDLILRFGIDESKLENGIVFGIDISLNQPTKINEIYINSISKYPIEVIGVYYTIESYDHSTSSPIHINHIINKYNIDDLLIYLNDTIEAKDVIIIIKQPYFEHKYLPDTLIDYDTYINNIIDTANSYTVDKIKNINYSMSNKIQAIIDRIKAITNIERMRPKQYIYNIVINSISINYNRYDDASTFLTDTIIEDKNINYISIINTNNVTSASNIIKYNVKINGTDYPIVPYNDNKYTQIIEILDKDITTYPLDLLADIDQEIKVYRNGTNYTNYAIHSIYNKIGYEINILGNITKNDIFSIVFTPINKDGNDRHVNYRRLEIANIFKPNIKNKQCINNKQSNLILVKYNDGIKAQTIGTDIHRAQIKFPDGEEAGWYITNVIGSAPSNSVTYPDNTIGIHQDDVILPQNTVYYGILNEIITLQDDVTSDEVFTTQYEYVPGSLFVWWKEKELLLKIKEYDADTSSSTNQHNTFTLLIDNFTIPKNDTLLLQYAPISFTDGVSNINTFNATESFKRTKDKKIRLANVPYIDKDIVIRANKTYNDWIYANGSFVYKYNQNTIYTPIEVVIDGIRATNKTEYINNKKGKLNKFINQLNNYEYIIDGYDIIFNTDIKDRNIRVSYYTNSNKYNIEAILYRTDRTNDITTPLLNPFGVIVTYEK